MQCAALLSLSHLLLFFSLAAPSSLSAQTSAAAGSSHRRRKIHSSRSTILRFLAAGVSPWSPLASPPSCVVHHRKVKAYGPQLPPWPPLQLLSSSSTWAGHLGLSLFLLVLTVSLR
jgi:hypothetical protein